MYFSAESTLRSLMSEKSPLTFKHPVIPVLDTLFLYVSQLDGICSQILTTTMEKEENCYRSNNTVN